VGGMLGRAFSTHLRDGRCEARRDDLITSTDLPTEVNVGPFTAPLVMWSARLAPAVFPAAATRRVRKALVAPTLDVRRTDVIVTCVGVRPPGDNLRLSGGLVSTPPDCQRGGSSVAP